MLNRICRTRTGDTDFGDTSKETSTRGKTNISKHRHRHSQDRIVPDSNLTDSDNGHLELHGDRLGARPRIRLRRLSGIFMNEILWPSSEDFKVKAPTILDKIFEEES